MSWTRGGGNPQRPLYVATQHGTLYALDAESGALLLKDTFLNVVDPTQSSGSSSSSSSTTTMTSLPAISWEQWQQQRRDDMDLLK